MFDQPTKADIDRALSTLMHEAQESLATKCIQVFAEANKIGSRQNSRIILSVAAAADEVQAVSMEQAASILREYVQRMGIPASQVTAWTRPQLESLGNKLLEAVSQCGFPNEEKRIIGQSQVRFEQRLSETLRNVEIGFVKGGGFVGVPKLDEWISAAEAISMLKPNLHESSARLRICERAHSGLIRARADQFEEGQRSFENHDIPKEFWWAEGHIALEQDWIVGDFSTWIRNGSVQLKAFGVTFARADITELLPSFSRANAEVSSFTKEDEQIVEKLDRLAPTAALSYNQAVLDLGDSNRVSFRGPALELRESLRETLDYLAPDNQVVSAPGYAQEKDRSGPTMKQKVRFIMKNKAKRASSDAPEQAVTAFEEAIATLTRAVYERSSKATHIAGERQAVVQLRRYVVAILHEILGV